MVLAKILVCTLERGSQEVKSVMVSDSRREYVSPEKDL